MNRPVISVILATFNSAKTLQRCLDSFRAQDYTDRELIIMDGGSSDGTREIISSNSDMVSFWESAPDSGIYNAWNKALPHVKGEWIYFIGSDDYFCNSEVLSNAAALLAKSFPPYRVAYGLVDLVDSSGRVLLTAGEPWDRDKFRQSMSIPHQGVFQHKSLFAEYGKFDEVFRIVGDYELLLRELKSRDALFFPGLKVAAMSCGGVSSNPANSIKALKEISFARRKLGVGGFPWRLYWAYFKACGRATISKLLGDSAAEKAAKLYRQLSGRVIT